MTVQRLARPTAPPRLDREAERQAREWLRIRSRAAFIGLLLLAAVSAVLVVAPVIFVLAAFLHRAMAASLAGEGVLVPATGPGGPGAHATAGEAWNQSAATSGFRRYAPDELAPMVEATNGLIGVVGRFVPAVLVPYEFRLNGKRYRVNKYMFTGERFYLDDAAQAWALVHPRYPRLNHWLVGRLDR